MLINKQLGENKRLEGKSETLNHQEDIQELKDNLDRKEYLL